MLKSHENTMPVRKMVLIWTIIMMIGIVCLLLIPAFHFLAYYQHYLLSILPGDYDPIAWSIFFIKSPIATVIMILGLIVYTDLAFPLAMMSFGLILNNVDFGGHLQSDEFNNNIAGQKKVNDLNNNRPKADFKEECVS
ncbi:unnamed protein product [Bursaphelenchus xylophilus]|uniref:(pine wood nematode) hypothetical protein n=1 Tax=Bursaphelenchus xylophilus TaxID=6326 RepID=A0A1I7RRE8_BURXY|nr:unnamed protein product [Bursaphelenchus xylophilus]CAG9130986.1 unnamed protein product [Bursaphelenchus xylophilus]